MTPTVTVERVDRLIAAVDDCGTRDEVLLGSGATFEIMPMTELREILEHARRALDADPRET